ncbi:MAG: type VI secretion system baseplate subunit TssK [Zoogloea sp.]|nr:type VI secretion system baseplate subunit TssK [Zoogloea sp.]
MQRSSRILWGEGLFLRPQHFQQQDLYFESCLAQSLRQAQAYPWGIRKAVLDPDALRSKLLRLNTLDAVFQDGTHVEAPGGHPLPPARNLDDTPLTATQTVVYACFPTLNPFGGNCEEGAGAAGRNPRFVIDRHMVPDMCTEALEAEIDTLHANLRLMLDEEDRDGHYCLPVARIARNANGQWEIDDSFIPPLVDIAGSQHLALIVRRLLDILLVKSQALAATHRERVKSVVEYATSDIASFWLLHTVNRAFPLLAHHAATPTHPETLYRLLAQLCGELVTFSSEVSLRDIPAYRHDDPTEVFGRLDSLLRGLLETVVSNRYAAIPLINTKPSFFVGRLDSERLIENVDYYLSVSGEMPAAQLIEMTSIKLKAGSPDDVEKILNSALAGVRLVHAAQTPVALPVRVGNHYFVLEPQGQIFERMLKARSICIYVPQSLQELKLELFAVFH